SWIGARRWSSRVRRSFVFMVLHIPSVRSRQTKNASRRTGRLAFAMHTGAPRSAPTGAGRAKARRIVSRVYIAILLLLLLLTVSQVFTAGTQFLVIKEPTYKIRAFNSINKATHVAARQWTRLSVWPWPPCEGGPG